MPDCSPNPKPYDNAQLSSGEFSVRYAGLFSELLQDAPHAKKEKIAWFSVRYAGLFSELGSEQPDKLLEIGLVSAMPDCSPNLDLYSRVIYGDTV